MRNLKVQGLEKLLVEYGLNSIIVMEWLLILTKAIMDLVKVFSMKQWKCIDIMQIQDFTTARKSGNIILTY